MKILFDPEIFFYGRCGMVRYYSSLLDELGKSGITIDLPLLLSKSDFISGTIQSAEALITLPIVGRRIENRIQLRSKKNYWRKVSEGNYDLLFISSPVFEDSFLNYLPKGKQFVMVVHDTMRCVLGPEGLFDPAGDNADRLAFLTRRASKVICISQKVKEDLLLLAAIEEHHTSVIYTGNLLNIKKEEEIKDKLPEKYLFFMGARTGRKNFRFFVQSVADIILENSLYIVCTGKCTPWEKDLLDSLKLTPRVIFVDAPDPVLVNLYKNAICLIYPSLYEGFGLPVVEAMSLGCPVITSEYGALKEIGEDAVLYVNPYDSISIKAAVEMIIQNPELREQLRQDGLKQHQKFSTDRMAKNFIHEFKSLI